MAPIIHAEAVRVQGDRQTPVAESFHPAARYSFRLRPRVTTL